MPVLICYDIEKNALRTRMGHKIIEYGLERINRSVYLGAPSDRELAELEALLRQWMAKAGQPQDSLILLPVTIQQVYRMTVIGQNALDATELAGESHTLIL